MYFVGADFGTESVRIGIFSADGSIISESSASYFTHYGPEAGFCEQEPSSWWESFEIVSLCVDTTACSVVICDEEMVPLRNCLLWSDSRSYRETQKILEVGLGDPYLEVNSGGKGPISAEWMIPKALWLKNHEPQHYNRPGSRICEFQDWINFRLTRRYISSSCNTASRWHFCGGPPKSLLEKLDMSELLDKWPSEMVNTGEIIGKLTQDASKHCGLPNHVDVVQGGNDAYMGLLGTGCVQPGRLCLITGSSHLHLAISADNTCGESFWGAYKNAPLVGLNFAEGGQSSTGSVLRWAKNLFSDNDENSSVTFASLDSEAESRPIGANGVRALETFQGARTPKTRPEAKGAILGLTLGSTRADIWRALLEAICLGTRACIDGMVTAGLIDETSDLYISGGATKSPFFLQMHADVTRRACVVGAAQNSVLLGSAILAAAASGNFGLVEEAMTRVIKRIEPNPTRSMSYDRIYHSYIHLNDRTLNEVHKNL
eukprot:GSChrysophyteH1.ASY1.ANO1.807.1 assembled CDS